MLQQNSNEIRARSANRVNIYTKTYQKQKKKLKGIIKYQNNKKNVETLKLNSNEANQSNVNRENVSKRNSYENLTRPFLTILIKTWDKAGYLKDKFRSKGKSSADINKTYFSTKYRNTYDHLMNRLEKNVSHEDENPDYLNLSDTRGEREMETRGYYLNLSEANPNRSLFSHEVKTLKPLNTAKYKEPHIMIKTEQLQMKTTVDKLLNHRESSTYNDNPNKWKEQVSFDEIGKFQKTNLSLTNFSAPNKGSSRMKKSSSLNFYLTNGYSNKDDYDNKELRNDNTRHQQDVKPEKNPVQQYGAFTVRNSYDDSPEQSRDEINHKNNEAKKMVPLLKYHLEKLRDLKQNLYLDRKNFKRSHLASSLPNEEKKLKHSEENEKDMKQQLISYNSSYQYDDITAYINNTLSETANTLANIASRGDKDSITLVEKVVDQLYAGIKAGIRHLIFLANKRGAVDNLNYVTNKLNDVFDLVALQEKLSRNGTSMNETLKSVRPYPKPKTVRKLSFGENERQDQETEINSDKKKDSDEMKRYPATMNDLTLMEKRLNETHNKSQNNLVDMIDTDSDLLESSIRDPVSENSDHQNTSRFDPNNYASDINAKTQANNERRIDDNDKYPYSNTETNHRYVFKVRTPKKVEKVLKQKASDSFIFQKDIFLQYHKGRREINLTKNESDINKCALYCNHHCNKKCMKLGCCQEMKALLSFFQNVAKRKKKIYKQKGIFSKLLIFNYLICFFYLKPEALLNLLFSRFNCMSL